MSTVPGDNPIAPTTVDKMTDEQVDVMLTGIRERRMQSFVVFQEAELLRKETRNEKLRDKIEQHNKMLSKELATLDKAIEKVEQRVLKIRAAKMELED